MPSNTPQLDSEELHDVLDEFVVETWFKAQKAQGGAGEQLDKLMLIVAQLIQADRAAFADLVLAIVPEKTDEYADNLSDTTKSFIMGQNQAIDQVTTAITNLVAEERGEKRDERRI